MLPRAIDFLDHNLLRNGTALIAVQIGEDPNLVIMQMGQGVNEYAWINNEFVFTLGAMKPGEIRSIRFVLPATKDVPASDIKIDGVSVVFYP